MHDDEAAGGDELDDKVSVRDGVQTILRRPFKVQKLGRQVPVDVVSGARQGCTSEGTDVHPFPTVDESVDIALEHAGVGEEIVSEGDGLSDLKVGEAGHDGLGVFVAQVRQVLHDVEEELYDDVSVLAGVLPQVCDDLVIAAATCVEFSSGVT